MIILMNILMSISMIILLNILMNIWMNNLNLKFANVLFIMEYFYIRTRVIINKYVSYCMNCANKIHLFAQQYYEISANYLLIRFAHTFLDVWHKMFQ